MDAIRDSGFYPTTAPEVRVVDDFADVVESVSPAERLHLIRARSLRFRERMLAQPKAVYFQSFELGRIPYPTRYGLLNAFAGTTPFMHLTMRMMVVQYESTDGIKTLLFCPSDLERNRETPFFKRLASAAGPLSGLGHKLLAPRLNTVRGALEEAGIEPSDVDYIAYNDLHTQDLRRWLGTQDEPALLPNAKLLIQRQEWESVRAPLPPQRDWYCPRGVRGIDEGKVVLLDSDVLLGEGVALIQTPGHTEGNHSLVAHLEQGVVVISDNGVAADSYAPLKSRVPGVREYARNTGMEAVLNGNTLERGLDQYLSMIKEKTIAGPCFSNPDFSNVYPSSEMTGYRLFPRTRPTLALGLLRHGERATAEVIRRSRAAGAAA